MPKSMTAFARVSARHSWGTLTWEVRSINHRYLEPVFRLPETLRDLETRGRELMRRLVARGKIDCTLHLDQGDSNNDIAVNIDKANQYVRAAEHIATLIATPAPIDPLSLLDKPGVMVGDTLDMEEVKDAALELFEAAMVDLVAHRTREGTRLTEFVGERVADVSSIINMVAASMPELLQAQSERLRRRLAELAAQPNQDRLEQELVYLAQKADIAEELDRLRSHVEEITRCLAAKTPVGRRLDFLMQELNREANTLSSKSCSSKTTHAAVELKVLIEQMREQIQNLE